MIYKFNLICFYMFHLIIINFNIRNKFQFKCFTLYTDIVCFMFHLIISIHFYFVFL